MQPVDRSHLALRDALVGQILRGSAGTNYYLRQLIGEGGQGWVFKANWDEPGGIVVIVKVLRPDSVQPDAFSRFRREAEVLRLLSTQPTPNPYIVRFFDHSVTEMRMPIGPSVALPFTVLEYVAGPTLEAVLAQSRGRGWVVERVRRLGRQAVQALELVHSQNVVHRDLKPSNILLATEGGAEVSKITDFGIVKRADMNVQRTATLAGASLGYAPPEQYEHGNERVSPKTDLFSFAAILWEMLAGQMAFPFHAKENPLLIVTRILKGPRPALANVANQLAPELSNRAELVREMDKQFARALAADPADRHDSVGEFWGKVEPILRDVTTASGDAPPSMLPFASTEASPVRNGSRSNEASGVRTSHNPSRLPSDAPQPARVRVHQVHPAPAPPPPALAPRQRVSDPGANPVAWSWRIMSRSIQDNLVGSAAFSPGGDYAVAVGPGGLARWSRGTWTSFAPPQRIDVRDIQRVKVTDEGDLILFGHRSLAARVSARGGAEVWSLPSRDLSFFGAHENGGVVTLVGERVPAPGQGALESVAAAVQLSQGTLTFLADAPSVPRLHGVTRIESGIVLGVGERGVLVRLDRGAIEFMGSICRGHLSAIEASSDGGALTVGGGGHALYISPNLDAQLEAVQTTRDLSALTVYGGVAWAGAAQARLLRREGMSWVRMSGDVGISPRIVSIWVNPQVVRAVCDDGAVLEGRTA